MKEQFSINTELNALALEVYNSWLDSDQHSAFTGGEASIKNEVGSNFSAWDGYISGQIKELEEGKRILHSWRTIEFSKDDEDSILEVLFEDTTNGNCKITINHSNLAKGGGEKYNIGWEENYFQPMRTYFEK